MQSDNGWDGGRNKMWSLNYKQLSFSKYDDEMKRSTSTRQVTEVLSNESNMYLHKSFFPGDMHVFGKLKNLYHPPVFIWLKTRFQ